MEQVLHSRMVLISNCIRTLSDKAPSFGLMNGRKKSQRVLQRAMLMSFIFIRAPRCSFLCWISLLCSIHPCDEHCWWRSHKSLSHDTRLDFHHDRLLHDHRMSWTSDPTPPVLHSSFCYDSIEKLDQESLVFFFFLSNLEH